MNALRIKEIAITPIDRLDVFDEPLLQEGHQFQSNIRSARVELLLKGDHLVDQRLMFDSMLRQLWISVFLHQFFFLAEVLDGVVNQTAKDIPGDTLAASRTHGAIELL